VRVRFWLSAAVSLLVLPAGALAHARLVASGTAGDGVRLSYSAPIERAFLSITGDDGRPLVAARDPQDDHSVIVRNADDAPGLVWFVLSRDGHVTEGAVDLTAAHTTSPTVSRVSPGSVAADVLTFAGLVGLLGLLTMRLGIVAPAWRTGGTRPPGGGPIAAWQATVARSLASGIGTWWRVWWAFVASAAFGLLCAPIALLLELDRGGSDVGALLGTRWGAAWAIQATCLVAATAGAYGLWRAEDRSAPDPRRAWASVIGAPLAVAVVAISWAGHAGSGTDAAIGIGMDAVHLAATGAWLGGLSAVLAIVPGVVRGVAAEDATRLIAAVVVRFSTLAILCVATLVVTGFYRAVAELRGLGDLVNTDYGRALLVKLIIFAVLLAGGTYNRLVLHPRLERAALGLRETDGGAGRALRISVAMELTLAVLVLGTVGVLVNLPPP
jgi:copper transport protein